MKEILRGLCVFLRWHLVTSTSEGKQLCYFVPQTLHNIFERFCTKKTTKSVLQWLTVSKSFCDLTKLKTTFVNKYLLLFQSICIFSLPLLFSSIIKLKNRHVTRGQFEWERPIEATDNIIFFPVGFRLGSQDRFQYRNICV